MVRARLLIVPAIAMAVALVMLASGNDAIAKDAPQELRASLAQQDIVLETLTDRERGSLESDGVGVSRARAVALQDQPTADSSDVFAGRLTSVEPHDAVTLLEGTEGRVVYAVLLQGVDIPLRGPYSDDRMERQASVSVPFVVFVDASSGRVLMGTSL